MSPTVYPTCPPAGGERAFFSALPRPVWALVAAGRLKRADTTLLGVLLDYKSRGGSIVQPTQRTLAARLGCSVDTVQRGLARLTAAGLIRKQSGRDAAGRLVPLHYDLAGVLACMPVQAAKLRRGDWGTPPASPISSPPSSRPQNCGPQAEKKDVVQADTDTPLSDAGRALVGVGVSVRVACDLVKEFGEAACRRQVDALPGRRKVRDRAATVVAAIRGRWTLPPAGPSPSPVPRAVESDAPRYHQPYRPAPLPPAPLPAAPFPVVPKGLDAPSADPLDALPPDHRRRLEARARADLARLPDLRPHLHRDGGSRVVLSRMRTLRTQELRVQEASGPAG